MFFSQLLRLLCLILLLSQVSHGRYYLIFICGPIPEQGLGSDQDKLRPAPPSPRRPQEGTLRP
ncbi:hypothetical protein MKW98_009955 [Papaver atlanticum]|uniref:Uncharacterized protein n=1 Tax=Papaver atlanticum TaxID=357466 RepID=A0AAD4T3N4_9MAGN|nr:hypothetical protein MKW98_009955 [Papaver atlanticum]